MKRRRHFRVDCTKRVMVNILVVCVQQLRGKLRITPPDHLRVMLFKNILILYYSCSWKKYTYMHLKKILIRFHRRTACKWLLYYYYDPWCIRIKQYTTIKNINCIFSKLIRCQDGKVNIFMCLCHRGFRSFRVTKRDLFLHSCFTLFSLVSSTEFLPPSYMWKMTAVAALPWQ